MIRLIMGDCLEVLGKIPDNSVDAIIADPPYGMTIYRGDSQIPLKPLWEELDRIITSQGVIIMTCSQPYTSLLICSNLRGFKYCLVWDKVISTGFQLSAKRPLKQHEDIAVFYHGASRYNPQKVLRDKPRTYNRKCPASGSGLREIKHDGKSRTLTHFFPKSIIRISNANRKKLHPSQKPLTLMEYLVKTYTNKGDCVLDFCMGSGTTGIACINLHRDFIGVEKNKKTFRVANERITNHKGAKK